MTKSNVSIIDYGVGNIRAFAQLYRRLNMNVKIADSIADIVAAKRLILPGVGAFDWAMNRLNQSGLRGAIDTAVLERNAPILGVCVGMQMMAACSDEGQAPGLGWIDAEVRHFDSMTTAPRHPLPHMGWNDVTTTDAQSKLFAGLHEPRFYFLHSYCVNTNDQDDVIATAHYGTSFTAALHRGNIYGTQFHPEKSHHWGVGVLRNFADIV